MPRKRKHYHPIMNETVWQVVQAARNDYLNCDDDGTDLESLVHGAALNIVCEFAAENGIDLNYEDGLSALINVFEIERTPVVLGLVEPKVLNVRQWKAHCNDLPPILVPP